MRLPKSEAQTSDCVKNLLWEGVIHLAAKPGDLDIDDVVQWRESRTLFPHITSQHLAGDRTPAVLGKEKQNIEFARGQVKMDSCPGCGAHSWIQAKISDLEGAGRGDRLDPAEQSFYPRDQLGKRERLAEVVVRSSPEPFHAIFHGVVGGEHEHARVDLLLTDLPKHVETSSVRQCQVEHQDIGSLAVDEKEALFPCGGLIHLVALGPQADRQRVGELPVILDDKDPCMF